MANLDLTLLHIDLFKRISRVLAAMEALGFPMKVVQGVRTTEQQQKLYAQGRTAPGAIVTKCDGVINRSNHQVAPDGYGRACDCAFVGEKPFDESWPWECYGACVVAVGLVWGGHFKTLVDRPHAELP